MRDHPLDEVFPAQPSVVVAESPRHDDPQVRVACPRHAGARRDQVEDIGSVQADHESPAGALRSPVKGDSSVDILGRPRHEDAAFWNDAFLTKLEDRDTRFAVVAQIRKPLRDLLPALNYRGVNADWEMAECEYQAPTWLEPRRHVLARRLVETAEHHLTLFQLGRYYYRGWVTNPDLTPPGVWHFYDSRAAIEVRIRELREDFAFANIPRRAFAANNLHLEVIRFAYNLVTAFQRACPMIGRASPC